MPIAPAPYAAPPWLLDACRMGVALRAVLWVELVLCVGAMYGAVDGHDWLLRLSVLTAGSLPATLLWLLTACALQRVLQRLPIRGQWAISLGLGAMAGLYACATWALIHGGQWAGAPWLASAASGALLAATLVTALVLRAKGRTPAQTTAQLADLQARIRPHFLFNTLNSAIALVRAEPAQAETLLEDLSDLFRSALRASAQAVSLAEEITLAQRYLAIEQVRFGDRLQVQWQLDPQANSAQLPPLLLQPLVENAVRHGVEPSTQGGMLRVSTQLRGSRVLIDISNTLPRNTNMPAAASAGQGMALANVRARLVLLHDVQCQFSAGIHQGLFWVHIVLPAPTHPVPPDHAHPDR